MKVYARIVDACIFLLIVLFIYSGITKLLQNNLFRYQLEQYPWLTTAARGLALALPLMELGVAGLLLTSWRLIGIYSAFLLLLVFTGYLFYMLGTQTTLPCSCGGVIGNLSWTQHLWFNIFFIAICITGILCSHKKDTQKSSHQLNLIV
jgi:hypothetical protein